MANEDIYGNKRKYLRSLELLDELVLPIEKRTNVTRQVYRCQNGDNLKYFRRLHHHFEAIDISYIRRGRLFQNMRIIVHATKKDLKDLDRDDINEIVAFMHSRHKSPHSKSDFILHIRYIWRILFPELDERGRADERVTPYVVRHLKNKVDSSKQTRDWDPLTQEEFSKILNYFELYPAMQSFLCLAHDALIRPQELCWRKMKDVHVYEDRVEIVIRDHGKEGVRTSWSFKALPYVLAWLNRHPDRDNPEAYFFLNKDLEMFKPQAVNKALRKALKELGINKRMTAYKLNHQGITDQFANPAIIQKKRGWTGLKQLKVYDHSTYKAAMELERDLRDNSGDFVSCFVCKAKNRRDALTCEGCKRRLDGTLDEKEGKTVDYLEVFLKRPEIKEQFKEVVREIMVKESV